jgi:hypothetical protein
MKRIHGGAVLALSALAFMSCLSAPVDKAAKAEEPETPRRVFTSESTAGLGFSDMFIVNPNYQKASLQASENSKALSALLLATDLGIKEKVSPQDLKKISELFFSHLPAEGEVKEIVIPGLSRYKVTGSEKETPELDGYFFIAQRKTNGSQIIYTVETNIPMGSLYAKDYDGYVMEPNQSFFKEVVPASWVSVMNIIHNDQVIVYQGVAYPDRLAPLYFSGSGIAPDTGLKKLVEPGLSITALMGELESTVHEATREEPLDEAERNSLRLLKKYADLSLALYAYVSGDEAQSRAYLRRAQGIDVNLPENARGSQCGRLQELMEYLDR